MKNGKIIVVDDSALMRKIISDMINSSDNLEVVETCRNGQELLNKLPLKEIDAITLDVEMPIMDGLTTLKEMKKRNINIPVVVLSSISQRGTQLSMDCLDAGAFDIISKPSGNISLDIDKVKDELIMKLNASLSRKNLFSIDAQSVNISNNVQIPKKVTANISLNREIEAVVIGASTGGPKALYKVITQLPQNLDVPVLVVQHMPVGFTKAFAERLNSNSELKVVEAENNINIEKNVVYIAPGGFHTEVSKDKKIILNSDPSIWGVRPAVDKLFISASKVFGGNLLSVVLTGMGKDGAHGTSVIKDNGGITISEDESTCTIYGMPKAAYETKKVDMVLRLEEIASQIVKLVTTSRR